MPDRDEIIKYLLNSGVGALGGGALMGALGDREQDPAQHRKNMRNKMLMGALLGGTAGAGLTAGGELLNTTHDPYHGPVSGSYGIARGLTKYPAIDGAVAGVGVGGLGVRRDMRIGNALDKHLSSVKDPSFDLNNVDKSKGALNVMRNNAYGLMGSNSDTAMANSPKALEVLKNHFHVSGSDIAKMPSGRGPGSWPQLSQNREDIFGSLGQQVPQTERLMTGAKNLLRQGANATFARPQFGRSAYPMLQPNTVMDLIKNKAPLPFHIARGNLLSGAAAGAGGFLAGTAGNMVGSGMDNLLRGNE